MNLWSWVFTYIVNLFCRTNKLFWCASYLHWRWPYRRRCIPGIARQGWWLWHLSVCCPQRNMCMLFFERPLRGTMIVSSHTYIHKYTYMYIGSNRLQSHILWAQAFVEPAWGGWDQYNWIDTGLSRGKGGSNLTDLSWLRQCNPQKRNG